MTSTETKQRFNIKDVIEFLKNSGIAILRGEFLLRLNIGRFYLHILYTFVLIATAIWVSLMIDTTLITVEKNNKRINELQIELCEITYNKAAAQRRTAVEANLKRLGSDLAEPEKPAIRIDTKAEKNSNRK